jgi:hypothetical protein
VWGKAEENGTDYKTGDTGHVLPPEIKAFHIIDDCCVPVKEQYESYMVESDGNGLFLTFLAVFCSFNGF